MESHDDKLKSLLKAWRGVNPSPSFEANVWRRIRLAEGERRPAAVSGGLLDWLFLQPARITVAAALAGVFIGLSLGVIGGSGPSTPDLTLALNRPGTISGSYLHLMTGGQP
jgi:hypothetical protein